MAGKALATSCSARSRSRRGCAQCEQGAYRILASCSPMWPTAYAVYALLQTHIVQRAPRHRCQVAALGRQQCGLIALCLGRRCHPDSFRTSVSAVSPTDCPTLLPRFARLARHLAFASAGPGAPGLLVSPGDARLCIFRIRAWHTRPCDPALQTGKPQHWLLAANRPHRGTNDPRLFTFGSA